MSREGSLKSIVYFYLHLPVPRLENKCALTKDLMSSIQGSGMASLFVNWLSYSSQFSYGVSWCVPQKVPKDSSMDF